MFSKMRRNPPLVLVVVAILMVLLPLLAYLQYQWLGKVSEREREQMQSSLRRSLSQLRQDFNREIARIFLQFQLQVEPDNRSGEEYLKLYTHWNSTAPYPKLIQDIFLHQPSLADGTELQRLNLSAGVWETADWTSEFGPRRFLDPGAPVDGSAPAIVIPIPTLIKLSEEVPKFVSQADLGSVIVRLNLQYVREEFIPALIRSHFGDTASEYRIQVTDRNDNSRVIYSDEAATATADNGDAAEDLFALELHTYRNLMPATFHEEIVESQLPATTKMDVRVFHHFAAAARIGVDVQDYGQWKIAVRHRTGSLDAAVGQIRNRNLALSFSILTLLGISVAIILISTERARRLARQQMEFVSTVSHELRTPLAVICSAGDNLADGVVRDPDQLKTYGTLVRNEGRRLGEMVEQILSLAGMQSGLKKYRLVPTEAGSIMERALSALEVPIRDAGFTVERSISTAPLMVQADAASMDRAVQNLISNAIKYSGSSKWIGISMNQESGWVRIAVHDKGIGISSSERSHIFEAFYRGRSAVDGQIQGSGLGLCLVKQIVDAHSGEIEVSSNPEGGSTFCIKLPT
jgi:signal transduction histidine kinase